MNFGNYEPPLPEEPPLDWGDEAAYLDDAPPGGETRSDSGEGRPRNARPTQADYTAGSGYGDEQSYPFLSFAKNWKLETYDYLLGKPGEQREAFLLAQTPTLRIARSGGTTDITLLDRQGQAMNLERFLEVSQLRLNRFNAKTMKRLSRVFRKSYAFGFFNDLPLRQFGQYEDGKLLDPDNPAWDALGVIGPDVARSLVGKLDPAQREEYLHAGRFEATVLGPEGQWKGHFLVDPQAQGINLQAGSWKKEISCDRQVDGQPVFFVDLRPKHARSGDLFLDPQTYTNLYRYLVPNKTFMGWLEERTARFLETARSGVGIEDAQRLFFQGIDSEEQFQSRMKLPLFEYLARGGDLRRSPEMMKRFVGMYQEKLSKKTGHYSLPMPTAFSLYLTNAVALGDEFLRQMKPGQVYLDWERASAFVHPDDYPAVAARLGGGDQDDQLLLNYTRSLGGHHVVGSRRPNTQGEYWVWELMNPDFIRQNRIQPLEIDPAGFQKITQVADKRFEYGDHNPLPNEDAGAFSGFLDYANHVMQRARTFMTDLGKYINAQTAITLILGREQTEQAAPSEYIIDRLQKDLAPLGPIWTHIEDLARKVVDIPMPREAWRRLWGTLPAETRRKGFIEAPNHPMDLMADYFEQHLAYIERASRALQNFAAPPENITEQAGSQLDLKARLTGAYYKDFPPGIAQSEDYERAYNRLKTHLLRLPQGQRDAAILQMYASPFSGQTLADQRLEDKLLWLRGREQDGQPSVADLTFDTLTRAGYLQPRPRHGETILPAEESRPTHTLMLSDPQIDPKRLVGHAVQFENDESGTYLTASGIRMAKVAPQHGTIRGIGLVTRAFERENKRDKSTPLYSLGIASDDMELHLPPFQYRPPGSVNPGEVSVFRNLSEAPGRYDARSLSPLAAFALNAFEAWRSGQPIPPAGFRRQWFNPNEKQIKTYGGRALGKAPPDGYFQLPFEPRHLAGLADVYEEAGERWYAPAGAPIGSPEADAWNAWYANLTDAAQRSAQVLFAGTPEEVARRDVGGLPRSVRSDFLKWHFGGGPENQAAFADWVNALPEAAREPFERAYFGVYGEYLWQKGVGNPTHATQWAQYWNPFERANGLRWPMTWAEKHGLGRWGASPTAETAPPPQDEDAPPAEPPEGDPWTAVFEPRDPPPPGHPYERIFAHQRAHIQTVQDNALAGKNTAVFTPPGSGKTEYLKAIAATLRGVGIVVSPLNALNQNLANRISEETDHRILGIYVPGHPGYGRDDSEYRQQMEQVWRALRGSQPVALVMSPEKFSTLDQTSLGERLTGGVSWVAMDEAQEFGAYVGREMMSAMPDALRRIQGGREQMPLLMLGGTVDRRQEWAMRRAYSLDSVIREPIEAPHVNFEVYAPRNPREYVSNAVEFARQGGELKSLIYGFSTRLVENIADAINAAGMSARYYHRGQGARGRYMTDAELGVVQEQVNRQRRLEQHLVASSALGLGVDIQNVARVASYGPARVDEIIQRALRSRPNEFVLGHGGATFRLVATPEQYQQWGDEYAQDMTNLNPSMVAEAYEHARRQAYSPNWKDASDEIAKTLGGFVEVNYGMNENRGADIASILRQAGLLRMQLAPIQAGTDEQGKPRTDVAMTPVFSRVSDARQAIASSRYRDPYDLSDNLTFAGYTQKIGQRRAAEYDALGSFLGKLRGLDPKRAGALFKDAVLSVYAGRMEAGAPKAGLEAIGIKVLTGDGRDEIFEDSAFSGPESSEITITTYARAFARALASGGSIIGSIHSQPTGRSDRASGTDIEGLSQLGRIEIQEGDYTGRMLARAESEPPEEPPDDVAAQFNQAAENLPRNQAVRASEELRQIIGGMREINEILQRGARSLQDGGERFHTAARLSQEIYERLRPVAVEMAQAWGIQDAPAYRAYGSQLRALAAGYSDSPLGTALRALGQDYLGEAGQMSQAGVIGPRPAGRASEGGDGIGSRAYRLAYGMAMAHRMWNIAAAPVFQEGMRYAAQDFLAPALIGQPGGSQYMTAQSGFAARQEIIANAAGRGAYEQFGGVMDLPYALAGTTLGRSASRLWASAQVGTGMMTSMVDMGWQLGMMPGLENVGRFLGRAGIVAGASSLIAPLGFELYNSGALPAMLGEKAPAAGDELSLGNITRGVFGGEFYHDRIVNRVSEIGRQNDLGPWEKTKLLVSSLYLGYTSPSNRRGVLKSLGIQTNDTPQDRYALGGVTDDEIDTQERLERLIQKTGSSLDSNSFVNALSLLGGKDLTERFLGEFRKFGLQNANQLTAQLEAIGQAYGYRPGSAQYQQLGQQILGLSGPTDLWAMQSAAQQVSQFAGYLAPLMGYPNAAQYALRYNLNTPGAARSAASVLDKLTHYAGYPSASLPGAPAAVPPTHPTQVDKPSVQGGPVGMGDLHRSDDPLSPVSYGFDILTTLGGGPVIDNISVIERPAGRMPNGDRLEGDLRPPDRPAAERVRRDARRPTRSVAGLTPPPPPPDERLEQAREAYGAWRQGFSQSENELADQILGGDLRAASYAAWNDPTLIRGLGLSNPQAYKVFDRYGSPVYQSSGAEWMRFQNAQAAKGNAAADAYTGGGNNQGIQMVGSTVEQAMRFFNQERPGQTPGVSAGVSDRNMAQAWYDQGSQGLDWYVFNRQWAFQQQGFGLQQRQLDAARAYNQQMWGLQDQQRARQYRDSLADFAYSRQRMEVSNRYAQEQESLSWSRLTSGQAYQHWQLAFNYQGSLMQRGWEREDWQFQDQSRAMQFGWQMEDLNEAIRFSSGRERRRLVRQRDRAAASQNMDEQQVDRQRERQEQLWSREDERYKKELEYANSLMKLDVQQFELNKRQREETYQMERANLERKLGEFKDEFDLQTRIENAQRAYQKLQMDFQQQSLDIARQQAQVAHDAQVIMKSTTELYERTAGAMNQTAQYKPEAMIQKFAEMLKLLGGLNPAALTSAANVFSRMSQLDPTQLNAIANALS